MTKITLELHDDVVEAINKLKNVTDSGAELELPVGSVLFDNILNLRLLEKEAERYGKTLHFNTTDPTGLALLAVLSEDISEKDFLAKEFDPQMQNSFATTPQLKKTRRLRVPRLGSGALGKGKKKWLILGGVVIALLIFGGTSAALGKTHTAEVKLSVNSQPLTKSVAVKVVKDGETNADAKTLKGHAVTSTVTTVEKAETTGEKEIGEFASGEIRIFNKTTTEKEFEKGEVLNYSENDLDLQFELDEDVTVPAATEAKEDEGVPVITAGEASANIVALQIGEDSNLDKDTDLVFDDYDEDDFTAQVKEDLSGGKTDTIKVVTQEDLDALVLAATTKTTENASKDMQPGAGKKLIEGSTTTTISSEEFDKEVDDEAEEVILTQSATASGLAYATSDLDTILDNLLEDFIPEGYVLSAQDKEIEVEILGNADTTVLNDTEADLQVTIKTFVIPDINEDELKQNLVGKSLTDAQNMLSEIRNITTYELHMSPNIPLLQKLPRNPDKIMIEIERQ